MTRYLRAGAGVKGAIFRNGRILLLHRRDDLELVPGLWDLPGGGVETGEGLEEALIREVREETGLAVTVGRPIYACVSQARMTTGRRLTSVLVFYDCTSLARDKPRLDPSEHTEFAWVNQDEIPQFPIQTGQRNAIARAFEVQRRK